MKRAEVKAYEASVDKLCRKWSSDVAKARIHYKETIEKLNSALSKDINKIDAKNLNEDELEEMLKRIHEILDDTREGDLAFEVTADVKKKTVSLVIRYDSKIDPA